jgi:hypothetical protein
MTTTVSPRPAGTLNPTRQQLDELDALLQRMLDLPVHPLDKPEQTKVEEPAEEPPPPPHAVVHVERPAPVVRSSAQQPADAGRSPGRMAVRLPTPPISYTVVETASPRPLPPASGFEPRPSMLTPRLVPVTPPSQTPPAPPAAEAGQGETWVPLRSTWQPSASTWPPLAESWHQANSGATPPSTPRPIVELHPSPMPQPAAMDLPLSPMVPVAGAPGLSVATPNAVAANVSVPEEEKKAPVVEPQQGLSIEEAPVTVSWPLLPLVWFNQGFDACLAPLGAPGRWLSGNGRTVLGFIGLACLAAAVAIAVNAGMGWSW